MISANAIRHSHCSEPPDEILNVEAIYTALGDGKNGVGVVGNAAVPGKVSFLCPKKQQSEDPFRRKGPGLQSNNCSSVFIRTRHLFRTVTKSKLFVEQAVMVGALALQRQGCMLTGFDTGHWR